jgi:hypothetical protein
MATNRQTYDHSNITHTLSISASVASLTTLPTVSSPLNETPELYLNTQLVPRSKHTVSAIKTSQLMLYREIIAVCSEIHTKHINTVCGQNVELLNVKDRGTRSNHRTLEG